MKKWKCTECGHEFSQEDHPVSVLVLDTGFFAMACTHHPDLFDRAIVILHNAACAEVFAAKHPSIADKIRTLVMLNQEATKAREASKAAERASMN